MTSEIKKLKNQAKYHFKKYFEALTNMPKRGTCEKWRHDANFHFRKRMSIENKIFDLENQKKSDFFNPENKTDLD